MNTDTKRIVWIICGIVVSVVLLLPWLLPIDLLLVSISNLNRIDRIGISIAIFLVPVFGGVWAVLNTRRGIPWWLWVIGGVIASVLVGLFWWRLVPAFGLVNFAMHVGLPGGGRSNFWRDMILFSTIMIPMGFGGVWAVYGLVLFFLFVSRRFQKKE